MIKIRKVYGYKDFDKNLSVVKKFMHQNRLKENQLIKDELVNLYYPDSQFDEGKER